MDVNKSKGENWFYLLVYNPVIVARVHPHPNWLALFRFL